MATYFRRETDHERGIGYWQCVEICPKQVLKMKGDFPILDKEWCIGGEVCAISCPSSAVKQLGKFDAIPPNNFKELYDEILEE